MLLQSKPNSGQRRGNKLKKNTLCGFLLLLGVEILCASLSDAQTLNVSGITFTASAGGGAPQSQTVALDPVLSNGLQQVTVSKKANWLNVTPTSDSIWGSRLYFVASVNTSGLTAGLYTDTILLTMANSNGSVRNASAVVTLNITGGTASPKAALSSGALTFSASAGGSVPSAQTINISNPGGGTLNYSMGSSAPWLLVTPASGSMTTGTGTTTVTANTSGLAAGSYTGLLTLSGNASNAPQQVTVNLTVNSQSATPALAVSPASLSRSFPQGTKGPITSILAISNATGAQVINWTASDTANWIWRADSGATPNDLEVWYWPDGLAMGTYTSTVTVTGAGGSKVIPVSMTITEAGTAPSTGQPVPPTLTPTLAVNPPSVSVAYPVGSRGPMVFKLNVANIGGGGARQWTASDTASWIWRADSGTTPSVNELWFWPDGMAAGTYTAQVAVAMPGATNSTMTIPVTMTLGAAAAPAPTASVILSWNANSESDMAGYKVYYGTTSKSYTTAVNAGNVTNYTIPGLATGKTYYFEVSALDQSGNESGKSIEVSVVR